MNHALGKGRLEKSQTIAIIRLIPKKNAKSPSDYRPISLLCTDYKLMAVILAERLKTTLPETIGNGQRGGIPGRKISHSLTLFRDVIERVNELEDKTKKAGAAFVAIDLEKAFDYVDRKMLWLIMKEMGYPTDFINKLKTLYNECEMVIMNGGEECCTIAATNSVRQGCPLSMYLFEIFIEPLIVALDRELIGLHIGNKRLKVQAFADDLTVLIADQGDFVKMGKCLDNFCRFSGTKISKSKTTAMGLATWEGMTHWPVDWIASTTELKLLGINFFSLQLTSERNWEKIGNCITGILRDNTARILTTHQRSNFIKSFILSKAIYVAKVIECPKQVSDKILKETQRFLWQGKVERPPKRRIIPRRNR